jgi:hypothetical protein
MKSIAVILISACVIVYAAYMNNYLSGHFSAGMDYGAVRDFSRRYESGRVRALRPQYANVILIIMDGASRRFLHDETAAPHVIARWKECGLRYARASAMLPTVSAPNYYSLLTGAPPYIHGVTGNARRYPMYQKTSSVIRELGARNLSTAVVGFNWYKDMLGGTAEYVPAECCEREDSREVADQALRLLRSGNIPFLTVIHFLEPDSTAHARESAAGEEYAASIRNVDTQIGRLFEQIDGSCPDSLVILTADHGMARGGSHGGNDVSSVRVPLYVFFPRTGGLKARAGSEISREVLSASIAPTLAALAGAALPEFAASGPLVEALHGDRVMEYMYESILKMEKLAEQLGDGGTKSLTLSEDVPESLLRRMDYLSGMILGAPSQHRGTILFYQRIAASALALAFMLWAVYKSPPGVPVLLAVNALIIIPAGLVKGSIVSGVFYSTAAAIYVIVVFAVTLLTYRFALDGNALVRLRAPGYAGDAFAALLASTVLLGAFFMPFYSRAPDPCIYSARFFLLTLFSPVIIPSLLLLFDRAGGARYMLAGHTQGGQ